MASTSEFRNGLCIEWNNDIYQIVEFQHVKPGKGAAFVRTRMKSLTKGTTLEYNFNASEKISVARVETRNYQYLYPEEGNLVFMNIEDFEQITLPKTLIEGAEFLKEGDQVQVQVLTENETPLTAVLPQHVVLEVTYTETGLKGDTATNTLKPATVETGATVMVPLFVDTNTLIKIDTRTGTYIERVKR